MALYILHKNVLHTLWYFIHNRKEQNDLYLTTSTINQWWCSNVLCFHRWFLPSMMRSSSHYQRILSAYAPMLTGSTLRRATCCSYLDAVRWQDMPVDREEKQRNGTTWHKQVLAAGRQHVIYLLTKRRFWPFYRYYIYFVLQPRSGWLLSGKTRLVKADGNSWDNTTRGTKNRTCPSHFFSASTRFSCHWIGSWLRLKVFCGCFIGNIWCK